MLHVVFNQPQQQYVDETKFKSRIVRLFKVITTKAAAAGETHVQGATTVVNGTKTSVESSAKVQTESHRH